MKKMNAVNYHKVTETFEVSAIVYHVTDEGAVCIGQLVKLETDGALVAFADGESGWEHYSTLYT
jgi:hypothetical protein